MGAERAASGKHPTYHGVRCRNGKWVTEIREPRKESRIWLGTYPTAEMAAVAYDVAAYALRGADAVLNFPGEVASRPAPTTASPAAIRAAAKDAAASLLGKARVEASEAVALHGLGNDASEFVDDESMFNMPQLLVNMAEGMLLSPPTWSAHHSPEVLEWESLWSYQ
ncbi:hypothetical protein C4D60_Mb04t20540 [Musa balbisiana]|uniref:AP2/ERF domain-containing protein n=1 Tax=Musa balbisiana TaxID=52838 RepID=A0A4S8KDH5_MUSBA|nr:hypothetical protein C4D60_Mb04t20540 [Musa balbisiana]